MGIINRRGSNSPRSALTSSASLLTITAGAASWSGLAQAAGDETSSQVLLLPEHYELMENGVVVFKLETGENLSLAPGQYLILEDGLLLITDELAQASIYSLPVMGSVRAQLLSDLEQVATIDGTVAEATPAQTLSITEGQAPRLSEQVELQSYGLAQKSECEDGSDDEGCALPLGASSEASGSEGLAVGMSVAPGAMALLGMLMTSDQPAEEEEEEEEAGPPQVQWETEYWKMFDLNTLPGESDSEPKYFTEFQGDLYFSADATTDDSELWTFDGTTASLVEDIYTGSIPSNPGPMVVYDSALYFVATDAAVGRELFKFDGTDVTNVTNLNTSTEIAGGDSFLKYRICRSFRIRMNVSSNFKALFTLLDLTTLPTRYSSGNITKLMMLFE